MDENDLKYSIEVYENHAIIKDKLCSDALIVLINLCAQEGFTHLKCHEEEFFKFVKKCANV
jgi:hypothetical protein